jgi:hypothetical protein
MGSVRLRIERVCWAVPTPTVICGCPCQALSIHFHVRRPRPFLTQNKQMHTIVALDVAATRPVSPGVSYLVHIIVPFCADTVRNGSETQRSLEEGNWIIGSGIKISKHFQL